MCAGFVELQSELVSVERSVNCGEKPKTFIFVLKLSFSLLSTKTQLSRMFLSYCTRSALFPFSAKVLKIKINLFDDFRAVTPFDEND